MVKTDTVFIIYLMKLRPLTIPSGNVCDGVDHVDGAHGRGFTLGVAGMTLVPPRYILGQGEDLKHTHRSLSSIHEVYHKNC